MFENVCASYLTALLERFVLLREWALFESLSEHFLPFINHLAVRAGVSPRRSGVVVLRVLAAARTALEQGRVTDLDALVNFFHACVHMEVRAEQVVAVEECVPETGSSFRKLAER